jgi:predicted nucleic acid-binding protein
VSYLFDINVISKLRKASRCDPNVSRWFSGVHDDEVFLSVLTLGEIRQGVERIRRRDARAASRLERWLRGIVETFDERIVQIDSRIAEECGKDESAQSTAGHRRSAGGDGQDSQPDARHAQHEGRRKKRCHSWNSHTRKSETW